jgi:hypothetical protein
MPLDPSSMVSGFTSLFQGPALGAGPGAAKMAQIYFQYASQGIFLANKPAFTGSEQGVLASTLAAVFALPAPNPAAFGTAWAAGVMAFWLSPPIVVAGPVQAGLVTTAVTASIPAALAALVASPSNPAPAAAAQLAAALHAATMTVIATVAPPPSTMIPIA